MSMREVGYARQLCGECDVTRQCLNYALEGDERWGVWGGTTPPERLRALELHQGSIPAVMADYEAGTLMAKVERTRGGR